MILSVIICTFNEKNTIQEVVKSVQDVNLGLGWEKDILIVDNLSTDGTRDILKTLENEKNIRVIYQTTNFGKSHSMRTAIPLCYGDLLIPQDADFEYSPKEYPAMIKKLLDDDLDVVIGSRVVNGKGYHVYKINEWGIKFLTWFTNLLYGSNYTDVATCYKLMRTELIKNLDLKSNVMDLDFELCAIWAKRNWKVGEVKIDYFPRTFDEGRTMNIWKSGFSAFWVIIRERFSE